MCFVAGDRLDADRARRTRRTFEDRAGKCSGQAIWIRMGMQTGFPPDGTACAEVKLPENAYLSGDSYGPGWACKRNYKTVAGGCVAIGSLRTRISRIPIPTASSVSTGFERPKPPASPWSCRITVICPKPRRAGAGNASVAFARSAMPALRSRCRRTPISQIPRSVRVGIVSEDFARPAMHVRSSTFLKAPISTQPAGIGNASGASVRWAATVLPSNPRQRASRLHRRRLELRPAVLAPERGLRDSIGLAYHFRYARRALQSMDAMRMQEQDTDDWCRYPPHQISMPEVRA